MDAQEALKISESSLPSIIDGKYKSIMESIEWAIRNGRTDVALGFTPPCKDVIDRLEKEGYWFYSTGDDWMFPKIYGISWKKEERKKKWYHKIFSKR